MTRIVVADDDRLVLYTIAAGLRGAGYEVLEAEEGEQAYRLCVESAPDLALLDVRMPVMSGLEVARRLRLERDTPVLFLSAYGDADTVKQAVDEGALGYLVKPLDNTQIIPAIEAALARAGEIRKLRETEENLSAALKSSREISVAVGLIMERYDLRAEEAFEALRSYARSLRRKISDVAAGIVDGSVPADIRPFIRD